MSGVLERSWNQSGAGGFRLRLRRPWCPLDPQPFAPGSWLPVQLPAAASPPSVSSLACHPGCIPLPKTFSQLLKLQPGGGGRALRDRVWRGLACRPPRGAALAADLGARAAPSDCGAADRNAALPAPPASRGPRSCGSAPRWAALRLRPARPAASPAAPVRSRGPARSSRLCAPLPLPAAPRPPRGWGFPLPSPPPAPRPPGALPSPARPYVCVTARHARPPTSPRFQRGLPELRTRTALLKVSLRLALSLSLSLSVPSPAGRHLTPVPRRPWTPLCVSFPSLKGDSATRPAVAAATARGDLRTGRQQEEGCAAPAQSVSSAAQRDSGLPAPGVLGRLARCARLKFLKEGVQLFKVTAVTFPPEKGCPRGVPRFSIRLCASVPGMSCLGLPTRDVRAGAPDITSCIRSGV
jgi:hypothetical protein